ncbi:MAG: Trk system potassium transporter TrkA [Candidatus Hatepunaea meridiana]|nr:Trk system potassium transporter TrkA [Candidatus Hatepunaea meridiana]
MKIVVVGAGAVGYHLARTLSWEGHEVTLIDHDQSLVDRAGGSMDVMAVRGSGTSVSVLIQAGVQDSDLLIAVTSVDEVNIVSCMLAKQLGTKKRIARVRNQEYADPKTPVSLKGLGIDQVIQPELETAKEVVRMIRFPYAIDIVECANGKMVLVGLRIEKISDIINIPLEKLMPLYPDLNFRLVSIIRKGQTIIPSGKNVIQPNDIAYVISSYEDLPEVFNIAGKREEIAHDVMLLGGGMIGRMVGEMLEELKGYNVKLIEGDEERTQRAIQRLKNTIIVKGGEGIDFDILVLEGINEMGVFTALTDDDENNIVTSLFAKHLGVKRIITRISKSEYLPIIRAIGLDAVVNERILTSDAIVKFLLGGRIMALSSLQGTDADVIEFAVSAKSKAADKRLRDITFPDGSLIGAIDHKGDVNVAVGDSFIRSGDKVVVFCQPKAVPKLEKLFK